MTRGPRTAATLWLIVSLALALVIACGDERAPEGGRWGDGVYVQQAWTVARAVSGHRTHVVKNKVACSGCHDLSGVEVGRVDLRRCATCHEKEASLRHAEHAAQQRRGTGVSSDCTTCHAFTVDGSGHEDALKRVTAPRGAGGSSARLLELKPFSASDCGRCHARPVGDLPAVEVHGTQECTSCHRPHEDAQPRSAPCESCHEKVHATHQGGGKSPTEACRTCHEHQHARASDARSTCTDCHQRHEPRVPATALFEGGHTECVGCHRPHGFEKASAVDCRTCHQDQTVLGGGEIAAHSRCTNCHAPHAVKGGVDGACQRCHEGVHPDHPPRGATSACTGCHDPHPSRAHAGQRAKACSTCHTFSASDHGSHAGVECVKCHRPHQFALELSSTQTCQGCHSTEVAAVTANAGHGACRGCHGGLPHRPEALLTGCSSCHGAEQARVRAGHAQCRSCHEPHSGAESKPCGSCHAAEARTAGPGHGDCKSCHEPHSGSPANKPCASCHQHEHGTAHGQLSSGCATCHRPHGPKGVASPPPCSTCHQQSKLPGLHSEPKHAPCERCHSGHGDQPDLARQICLSCHRDRVRHFPDAPRCANCHLFTERP